YVPLAKPPVRKLAKDLGIDLRTIVPSSGDVITRDDVQRAAAGAKTAEAPAGVNGTPASVGARERRGPIKGGRRVTREGPSFAGVKLTPLAFAAKAMCMAVKRTPDVNATWDEEAGEIVYKDYVHLGVAAATPRGLVVPKIRDADSMSLVELAKALEELTTTADRKS